MTSKQEGTPIRISMESERYEISASLFDAVYGADEEDDQLFPVSPEEEMTMGILDDADSPDGYYVKPAPPEADGRSEEERVERLQLITEGQLFRLPDEANGAETVTIAYDESELTGMEGAHSTVIFRTDDPGLVHMVRSGSVSTALTFRAHHRAICMYHTPYMPFQIGIHSLVVDNRLLTDGELVLDYIIEIRGACAERTRMTFRIL